jgi:hypothetical protein
MSHECEHQRHSLFPSGVRGEKKRQVAVSGQTDFCQFHSAPPTGMRISDKSGTKFTLTLDQDEVTNESQKMRSKRHGCAQMLRFRRLGTVVAMLLIKKDPPVLKKPLFPAI